MPSYLYNAPAGFPGDVSRPDESNVEPAMLVALTGVFAQSYGIPVKYVAGGVQQWGAGGETKANFDAILVRGVPFQSGSIDSDSADINSSGIPLSTQVQGIMVRGYCMVKVVAGTPARGGVVYVQVTAHSGAVPGDFRADGTDSGNAVALDAVQAEWASDGVDALGFAELRVAR
jgi:hypothetical protein